MNGTEAELLGDGNSVDDIETEIVQGGKLEDLLAKYLNDFVIEDDTVIGYINDFETFKEILEKMKVQGFAYSVRDSDVRKKQRGKHKKNAQSGNDNINDKSDEISNLTVFFQLRAMPIKFFGMPFTIEKTTHYQCAYGCKYYKSKAGCSKMKHMDGTTEGKPDKKKKKVGSKKMGCLAKMTIKHITVYPAYELFVESDWRKKKMLIEKLRKDLSDMESKVERFQRFYLSVSVQSSHNHPPIIIIPKPKPQKRKAHRVLVKTNNNSKRAKLGSNYGKTDVSGGSTVIAAAAPTEAAETVKAVWGIEISEAPSLIVQGEEDCAERRETMTKVTDFQGENFFQTLINFPGAQDATVYEQAEYKQSRLEVEISPCDQGEAPQTVEVYEYQPTIQDLQTLFKEKLKRLYTLCTTCTNGSLLLRLAIDLEQVEVQLSNDVASGNV